LENLLVARRFSNLSTISKAWRRHYTLLILLVIKQMKNYAGFGAGLQGNPRAPFPWE
jgi:hypothetical protein